MNKKSIAKVSGIFGVLILITGWILYASEYKKYTIVLVVIGLILLVATIICLLDEKDEDSLYSSTLKNILKTYESILVRTKNIPELKSKKVLILPNIDEMANAQIELKKPIYYYREEECTSFFITTTDEVLLYINKLNEDIVSTTEILLKEIEEEEKRAEVNNNNASLLEGIEKTTIIRINGLNEYKTYKVSPIREEKEKKEVVVGVPEDMELPMKKDAVKKKKKKKKKKVIDEE